MEYEDIPLPEREGDDDEDRPDTPMQSEGETSYPTGTVSEGTPGSKVTLLTNELKRQKIQALYDFWGVGGSVNLAGLDRFQFNRNKKTGNTELKVLNNKDEWVLLTNSRNGEFLARSTVIGRINGELLIC